MSLNEEFDELARRKLEERQFPFQEADWQDARSRIDAQRRRRDRAAWFFGAGLLLLISGLAWYGTRPASVADTVAEGQVQTGRAQQVSSGSATTIAVNTSSQTTSSAVAPVANTVNSTGNSEPTLNDKVNAETNSSVVDHSDAAPRVKNLAIPAATVTPAPMRTPKNSGAAAAPAIARDHEAVQPTLAVISAVDPGDQLAATSTQSEQPRGEVMGSDAQQGDRHTLSSADASNDPQNTADGAPDVLDGSQLPIETEAIAETIDTSTKEEQVPVPENEALIAQGPVESATPAGPSVDQPTTTTPTDDPSTAAGSEASASVASAPPAPAAAPPLVPMLSPWEISAVGGVYSSTSTYSGSNSADWSGDISTERSVSGGAEIMHMGRNIGVGAGLHYGSYAERLRSDAIDLTTTSTENYWYLLPVDTTFFFITDTLPGQPPTYTGGPVDTTVNVLAQGTNTITNTERLREARDQVNRVSYLEVPLLLDAHLVQGRWGFGLRGGPTFGLSTGRRGSVPSADGEGYLEFSDMAFREFILGYTARAYARYRFNAAWSVGIEPAIRGQLMNSLDSGDLTRRASAKGVLISLSYRLR